MSSIRRVIGIDFGSSQSSIAIMEIGSTAKPELLKVGGGLNGQTIPTILALDKNDNSLIAAGNDVRQRYKQVSNSSVRLISDFKRYLGNDKILETDSPETVDAKKNAADYTLKFLSVLCRKVEEHFGLKHGELNSDDFVTCIAYPASWSPKQVKLLKELVKNAGFPADDFHGIYSLSEPEAAMHALRINNDFGFKFGNKPEYYMVIDFGGGTLDVCIIQTGILGMTPKTTSPVGDPELGGKDFDDIITNMFFKQNFDKISRDDLSDCEKFELRDRIREAKEAASEHFLQNQDHKHSLGLFSGQFELNLHKSEFVNIVKDYGIYDKVENCIDEALKQGGIQAEQITKVILTGGSSRWFFIREIVAKKFAIGGDWIYCTKTPFTDVATGCAVSIGLASQAPEKEGIWVKYRLSEKVPWSEVKCLLPPYRNDKLLQAGVQFIGVIPETIYFHPWRIYLSWWHGFEIDQLKQIGKEAVIEVFARSNFPFLEKIRNVKRAIKGEKWEELKDEYKIYLKYEEDDTGRRTYQFEIVDSEAAKYDALLEKLKNDGETPPKEMSKGWRCTGTIGPGVLSCQEKGGLGKRIRMDWPPNVSNNPRYSSKTQTPSKKKIKLPWEK